MADGETVYTLFFINAWIFLFYCRLAVRNMHFCIRESRFFPCASKRTTGGESGIRRHHSQWREQRRLTTMKEMHTIERNSASDLQHDGATRNGDGPQEEDGVDKQEHVQHDKLDKG